MVNPLLTMKLKRGRPPLPRTEVDVSGHQKSYNRYIAKLELSKRERIESKK